MAKLYPPYIENVLPAFTYDAERIIIPFQINRTVNRNDFKRLAIIIKTVSSGAIKVNGALSVGEVRYNPNKGCYEAQFTLRDQFEPRIGQYYKIQLAFERSSNQEIGYYSTVGVAKCTATPEISIDQLNIDEVNQNISTYIGRYSQSGENKDSTERVYSYRFDVMDINEKIVATSGECLHNSSEDTSVTESEDKWTMDLALDLNEEYNIRYSVKTLNNFEVSSLNYRIMEIDTKDLDHLHIKMVVENMTDEGYIKIGLTPKDGIVRRIQGHFILMRASSKNNFKSWNEIYRFDMVKETAENKHLWDDFSVEQGVIYRYCIQAYNSNSIYSNRLVSKDIMVDFEDCFLYDGERQLKIQFNPKVSSFKRTLLESKVDTLGGKYPFIFRNGRVDYKEFPISGLISLISDPNEYFMKGMYAADPGPRIGTGIPREEQDDSIFESKTAFTKENYYRERQFKLEALEWLSDGKPKLFRSAAEGNYIVRLINVSLSPMDSLGRMLHSFQCTAYEIAECTFSNLEKYGFIKGKEPAPQEVKIVCIPKVVEFFRDKDKYIDEDDNITYYQYNFPGLVEYIVWDNFRKDIKFKLIYQDGKKQDGNIIINNKTSSFRAEGIPITAIMMEDKLDGIPDIAMITYGYRDRVLTNDFVSITDIKVQDKIDQYIGCIDNQGHATLNLLETMADGVRTEVGRIHYLAVKPRDVVYIYKNNNDTGSQINSFYFDSGFLDRVHFQKEILYFVKNGGYFIEGCSHEDKDGLKGHIKLNMNYTIQINNEDYSDLTRHKVIHSDRNNRTVEVEGRFETLIDLDEVNRFVIGDGLIADVIYQLKTFTYSVEETNLIVAAAKQAWLDEQDTKNKTSKYKYYVKVLKEALEKEAEDSGYAI